MWWTPGHSPGHICFLERGKKFILTGDHVLPTITPNISMHVQQQGNPLGDYIASLKRLEDLDVDLVLPAHEYSFPDLKAACSASSSTTPNASTRCSSASAAAPAPAFDVAGRVKWVTGTLATFTPWMQRAALGETLSHLEYLVLEERLTKFMDDGVQYYKKSGND